MSTISNDGFSRRTFLRVAGGALGGAWLTLDLSKVAQAAHDAHDAHTARVSGGAPDTSFLSQAELADVDAIASQIIPTDDTPGAREAGVVTFIDRALSGFYGAHRADFLADYAAFAKQRPMRFADLTPERQIATLRSIETTRLFSALRFLTVLGFLASPSYGGNRNGIGWQVVGFKDDHHFSPPFGYYDRDYAGFVPYDVHKPA